MRKKMNKNKEYAVGVYKEINEEKDNENTN